MQPWDRRLNSICNFLAMELTMTSKRSNHDQKKGQVHLYDIVGYQTSITLEILIIVALSKIYCQDPR